MDRRTQELLGRILSYIHDVLPVPPTSRHSTGLSALLPHDDLDRLSGLPDDLLRVVVSRLPVTDAARTTALSRRWRGIWRSAPLVLVDSHLLPAGTGGLAPAQVARRVTSAVSHILAAHPGPFRCVHLIASSRESPGLLARWLQLLAVNDVQELVLANRPLSLDNKLPAALFGMATLTCLYLGIWKFPDTAGLSHATSFPNLRELGLCTVFLDSRDMDFILARSPLLEIMCLQGRLGMDRFTLVSRSLRCVQMMLASDLEISVLEAPHLERLIMWIASTRKGSRTRIKIVRAPVLSLLGYLELRFHTLQVGDTVIKAETKASPSTMLPAVKILGVRLCFGVRNEAEILPSILRCFPNVQRLHIESEKTSETADKLSLKFWEESGAIECIHSHLKLMVFKNFRGDPTELCFLKFFLESARMMTRLVIVYAKGCFTSVTEANSRVKPLFDTEWASNCCSLLLVEGAEEEEFFVNFGRGSDFSRHESLDIDPTSEELRWNSSSMWTMINTKICYRRGNP